MAFLQTTYVTLQYLIRNKNEIPIRSPHFILYAKIGNGQIIRFACGMSSKFMEI